MRSLLFLALALGITACGTDETDTVDDSDSTPAGDPTLTIVTPADGATFTGESVDIDVKVEVTDFKFVFRGDADDGSGVTQGFVLLKLDDKTPLDLNAPTTTYASIFPGEHHLSAEVLHADGTSFDPAITDEVTFTIVAN